MNKVLINSKLSTPSKFVRRVLSRTSNVSREIPSEVMKNKAERLLLESELESLKEQLSMLQVTVNSMQQDVEKKEKVVANLAREKQQLSTDLRREKRSTTNLKQQLDDEREFYYKEKEQYCQEMNDCKKLKKKLSQKDTSLDSVEAKNQVSKLKDALNRTLEANYNLSVKFLRMKNTKVSLKERLKKQEQEHEQAMHNLQVNINNIKNDIADVLDKRFMLPISPSNKKYLQIIKQNGMLMHENLCLQMEVDRLTGEVENLKAARLDIQVRSCPLHKTKTESKHVSIKLDKQSTPKRKSKSSKHPPKAEQEKQTKHEAPIIKIFERKEVAGIPDIVMLPQSNEPDTKIETTVKHIIKSASKTEKSSKQDTKSVSKINTEETLIPLAESQVLPVCKVPSQVGTEASDLTPTTSSYVVHTQSTPEIFQTSLFVSKLKP